LHSIPHVVAGAVAAAYRAVSEKLLRKSRDGRKSKQFGDCSKQSEDFMLKWTIIIRRRRLPTWPCTYI